MLSRTPKLLFIKLKHYGDVLLLTPALAAARRAYPGCHITVLVRDGTDQILAEGLADEILITVPPEKSRRGISTFYHQIALMRKLRRHFFDIVFELTDGDRGRWFGVIARASLRCTSSYGWKPGWFWRQLYKGMSDENWNLCHRVEKDHRLVRKFLPLMDEVPPPLAMPLACSRLGVPRPYVVIHASSRWRRKLWPVERWAAVGRKLTDRGLHCMISSGPDEEEKAGAEEMCRLIGRNADTTGGGLSWGRLASLIKDARLFVGIDTAAMHLAAACQTPVVALFGPSIEHQWRPWGGRHEIVTPSLMEEGPAFDPIYDSLKRSMLDISEQDVIAACERMLSATS